jgi:hypothetical protein
MTLTLEISPELAETLRAIAAREGVAPDRYVLDQRINEGLPEATWERYHALKEKRDAETLTDTEHDELIRLVNEVEGWNVRRLEAVAELAKLRSVPFPEMFKQLGLGPPNTP